MILQRETHLCLKLGVKQTLCLFVLGCLLCSLAACTPTSSSTQPHTVPSPTSAVPSPTATTLPAGTLLYQADWSHGLSGWQGTHGWKVVQGQLETDISDPAILTVPYRPIVADYAIEVRIELVRLLQKNGGYYLIVAPKQPQKDGYQAGVSNLKGSAELRPNGDHPQSQVVIDPPASEQAGTGRPIDYEPGFQWHTYRLEVQGSEARLLDDGVQIGDASSELTDNLSNGPIGLSCALIVLRVSSLRIVSL